MLLIQHIVLHGHFSLQFENIYILFWVEAVQTIVVRLLCRLYHQKRRKGFFSEVYYMTVNHCYICHPYYHDAWYFDLIQIMLHNFYPQSHQKHCCVRFVLNYYNIVLRKQCLCMDKNISTGHICRYGLLLCPW